MPRPISNRQIEILLIALATLAGAILRFWNLPRLGLDHFDEGIYALAGLWITSPKGLAAYDPGAIAYAPPGYPILVGLSYLIFGVRDTAAIVVSIIAGIATIPVVGWLGRRAFGAGAGAAAAWFCALSGPHVAFSRMALTDALALLTFLVALGLGMRFLERPGLVRALMFGLAVGLAQNVKYSGFLTGVIIALSWLVSLFHVEQRRRGTLLRTFGFGMLAAVVAGLCYLPWYLFVEAHGGYGQLILHQKGYWGGASHWWPHLRIQLDQQLALSGELFRTLTWAGAAWGLGWTSVLVLCHQRRSPKHAGNRYLSVLRLGLPAGVLFLGLMPNAVWFFSLGMVPWLVSDRSFGVRVAVCTLLVMSVLTPMYYPYARLWLTIHSTCWLIGGGLIARFVGIRYGSIELSGKEKLRSKVYWISITAVGLLVSSLAVLQRGPMFVHSSGKLPSSRPFPISEQPPSIYGGMFSGLLQRTDYLRTRVGLLQPQLRNGVRTLARPAVLFYLGVQGVAFKRMEFAESLIDGMQPGEQVLIDQVQWQQSIATNPKLADKIVSRLRSVSSSASYVLPPTTLLDLDPQTAHAFDPSSGSGGKYLSLVEASIWLLQAP